MICPGQIICVVITVFGGAMLIGRAVSELLSHGFVTMSIEGSLLFLIDIVALVGVFRPSGMIYLLANYWSQAQ